MMLGQLPEVTFSKRRTIAILINRNLEVKIKAPNQTDMEDIIKFFNLKKKWVEKKLDFFRNNPPQEVLQKTFSNGEKIRILGKILTIVISKTKDPEIKGDYIYFSKKSQFLSWRKAFALKIFTDRLDFCFSWFLQFYTFPEPTLLIRKMKARWGSMSSDGKMVLNISLIHVPTELIDYVIMHELCHLRWKGHGARFYSLQEKLVPNHKDMQKQLDAFIAEVNSY